MSWNLGHLFSENSKQHLVRWDLGWTNVSSCYLAQLWHLVEENELCSSIDGHWISTVLYVLYSILIVVHIGFWTSQQKFTNTRTIIWKVTPLKINMTLEHHHFQTWEIHLHSRCICTPQSCYLFWGVKCNYPPPQKKLGGLSQWPRSWDLKFWNSSKLPPLQHWGFSDNSTPRPGEIWGLFWQPKLRRSGVLCLAFFFVRKRNT